MPVNLSTPVQEGPYTAINTGEVAGSLTAKQCPNGSPTTTTSIPCKMVRFKAKGGNAGNVYLGHDSTVTAINGSDNVTAGLQLAAGDDTGWLLADNVNRFWIISDNAADGLTFLALNN